MTTHLIASDRFRRNRPACGVEVKPGSDYTAARAYVTCNKCRGTKLFLEAESGITPIHTSAIQYLEAALRDNDVAIRVGDEEDLEVDDPVEWDRLIEERDQLLISVATLKALQTVDLMVQKEI